MSLRELTKWRRLLQIFHDADDVGYGNQLTPTQIRIVDIIAKRRFPRTQLILPTQYGKSLSVALGVLLRVATHNEKWAIIAPTEEKARIIMDYIIDHIFDDPLFEEQLEYHDTKEKLKQQRSKSRITFRDGGEVRVYSADARNTQNTKRALMGFGAPNIILDESSLIPDDLYSTIKRMVGGSEGTRNGTFLLEIGNPFFRNHFHRTWKGSRYMKVFVDYETALAEGRYTRDYIDEMREEAFFDVLYECIFPEANEILPNGYRRLVKDELVDAAYIDGMPELKWQLDEDGEKVLNKWGFPMLDDKPVLGIDVSGAGSNQTKFIVRLPKHGIAFVAKTMSMPASEEDLEDVADEAEDVIKKWSIGDYRTMIDEGGVGYGLPAILKRRGYVVKAIQFGGSQETVGTKKKRAIPDNCVNYRAYMYMESRKWLRDKEAPGKLVRDEGFEELKLIYFKENATGKIQIEPKEEMIKREAAEGHAVQSPDTADGFVLTFVSTDNIVEEDDIFVD